ncbi:hypothetical protein [Lentilactobacillus hilgardii]|uniref:hypothetical protein n=1 Tax=Lentilactobacillus hilgardii TaxID=1588 RepID=UPI0021C3E61B|nr:hypothetical protein [Lentilactobacillus hilgardii]MCP9333910.1 hypothetical protein [Lentilactobacillus hilgardii]MCP9350509.1 hypothetical protein [Lentilactobacillus hilgardii]MCP9353405.1 hypothetical protein [Lentilactobacillus hilgardii]
MKLKGFVAGIAALSFVGIGLLSNSQQANAATWHKGTPVTLRGTYQYKLPKGSALGFGTRVKISSKKVEVNESGMPFTKMIHVHYKKTGKSYHIIGYILKAGMNPGGKASWEMYRKGNYFKYEGYQTFKRYGFRHVQFAKRVVH